MKNLQILCARYSVTVSKKSLILMSPTFVRLKGLKLKGVDQSMKKIIPEKCVKYLNISFLIEFIHLDVLDFGLHPLIRTIG